MKLTANYNRNTDKYIACITDEKGYSWNLERGNGEDLVKAVKAETGVDISYNWNVRGFEIPEENILD